MTAFAVLLPCLSDPRLGIFGIETDLARGGAGAGVDPLGQQLAVANGSALGFGIEDRLRAAGSDRRAATG